MTFFSSLDRPQFCALRPARTRGGIVLELQSLALFHVLFLQVLRLLGDRSNVVSAIHLHCCPRQNSRADTCAGRRPQDSCHAILRSIAPRLPVQIPTAYAKVSSVTDGAPLVADLGRGLSLSRGSEASPNCASFKASFRVSGPKLQNGLADCTG